MPRNFSYLRREFLNPPSTTKASYILAHVESSVQGGDRAIDNAIVIADCDHPPITLDFYLGTPEHRRQSLAKINLLLDILRGFKEALEKEYKLIEQHAAKKKE